MNIAFPRHLPVVLLVTLFLAGAAGQTFDPLSTEDLRQIRAAAPDTAPVKPAQPRKLLVYTGCQGFVHSAIPYATAALEVTGKKTGAFTVAATSDPTVFQPANLREFDAICLNNTTGELFDDPTWKQGLLDFVRAGKGLVGLHAATDCFYQWPEFGELMGGYFAGHPWNETVTVKLDEPEHPLAKMFGGAPFAIADEIYQFKDPYSRRRLRVLLSLDTLKTDMTKKGITRTDGDFAVSWVRNYGLGRVFYCSLGHRHDIFWNPRVLEHYLAGIQFALGDLPANALPSGWRDADGRFDLLAGDDLAGWIAKPGSWAVADGVLARQGGGDVWTEQTFGDFVLSVEFRLAPQTNSGIFIRTGDIRDCVQTGIEVQVLDSHGKAEVTKHDCGAVYDCLAPRVNAVKPPGEWNAAVITCRGPRIQVELNGAAIIDMNLDDWTVAGQNPDGTKNKFKTAYRDMPRRGRIGFQDHGHPVWYRCIRIQPLD